MTVFEKTYGIIRTALPCIKGTYLTNCVTFELRQKSFDPNTAVTIECWPDIPSFLNKATDLKVIITKGLPEGCKECKDYKDFLCVEKRSNCVHLHKGSSPKYPYSDIWITADSKDEVAAFEVGCFYQVCLVQA